MAKAKIVKIYESVFAQDLGLSHRKILQLVINYWKKKGQKMDGIMSLQAMKYWPVLVYPRLYSEILSSMDTEKLPSGYISYSDQDME